MIFSVIYNPTYTPDVSFNSKKDQVCAHHHHHSHEEIEKDKETWNNVNKLKIVIGDIKGDIRAYKGMLKTTTEKNILKNGARSSIESDKVLVKILEERIEEIKKGHSHKHRHSEKGKEHAPE